MTKMSRREMGLADLLGNGKTLKEHRDEVLERTKTTGFYNGLEKLEFKEADPITYEKLFSRIRGAWCMPARLRRKLLPLLSSNKKVSCVSRCTTQLATAY